MSGHQNVAEWTDSRSNNWQYRLKSRKSNQRFVPVCTEFLGSVSAPPSLTLFWISASRGDARLASFLASAEALIGARRWLSFAFSSSAPCVCPTRINPGTRG